MNTTTNGTTPAAPAAPASEPRNARSTPQDSSVLDGIMDATERYKKQLEPTTTDAAWQLCVDIAKLNLHGVKTPEDGLARVMLGRNMGLNAIASITSIFTLWNKTQETHTTVMYAKAKLGLLQVHRDIEYIYPGECTTTTATWIGKRKGDNQPEQQYTVTIEDARIAGRLDRGGTPEARAATNYTRHPKAMLSARACGRLCDIIGASAFLGLATAEDVSDEIAMANAIAAATDEVLARVVPNQTLEQKLAERPAPPPPPPPPAAPGRDFAEEANALKESIAAVAATKDKAEIARVRASFKAFQREAPSELAEEVLAFYNMMSGGKPGTVPHDPATGEVLPTDGAGSGG